MEIQIGRRDAEVAFCTTVASMQERAHRQVAYKGA